ncbi:MAG TPA: hypothetical protein VFE05_09605 [Longimicrobiaceae bacterium]|jgi:hypothetical protein|nr:hypothetical protein [Longimicrobiaceae bacterium]
MRKLLLAATLLAAAPLAAQTPAQHQGDPDVAARSAAPLPAGWHLRLDRADAKQADLTFTRMGSGYHFTGGPAAIFWRPTDRVSAPYTVRATLTQTRAPRHPEAYGVFAAGQNLDAPNQTYLYLVVRGDGKFLVKHRAGTEVHTVIDWTDSDAVHKADANGRATNTVEIRTAADSVRFVVNGTRVAAVGAGFGPGVAGLRLNHNLDIHVDSFRVSRGASRR